MSGGGKEKRTGRMGSAASVSPESNTELAQLEKEVEKIQEKLIVLHDRMRNCEDLVSTLTKDTRKWKFDLNGATAEIKDLLLDTTSLDQRIMEQELVVKSAAPNPEKMYELNSKVETLKKDYEKALEKSSVVQKEVDKFTSQIKAITGGRMKEAQSKLDATNKKLDKVNNEITKLKVEIKTSKRNLKKSRTKCEDLIVDIKEAEDRLHACDEELQKLRFDSNDHDEKLQEILENMKSKEITIKEIRSKKAEISTEVNQIKSAKIDEEQNLDKIKKKLADAKREPLSLQNCIAGLTLNHLPYRPPVPDLITYTSEELMSFEEQQVNVKQLTLHDRLKAWRPDLDSIGEFNEKDQAYKLRIDELEKAMILRNDTRDGYDDVRKARLNEFLEGFMIISMKLKEMYQTITIGGDAELDFKDSLDPFSEGITFNVRPPKKSWKDISNLSGGEKTLSSLALVFALHYYKPSPLYVMDEIDAALDFKNVSIVGRYIQKRTKNSQFIIISLRSNMIELADQLVGIYKINNTTQSITITPSLYSSD